MKNLFLFSTFSLFLTVFLISCSKSPSVPAPQKGKGNVVGNIIWNDKPAEKMEVVLCSSYSFIFHKCDGKSYKAYTDSDGAFVFRDVDPGNEYTILVNFGKENMYIYFYTKNTTFVEKFEVKEDKTLDVGERIIIKPDLKVSYPVNDTDIKESQPVIQWNVYDGAAYYKVKIAFIHDLKEKENDTVEQFFFDIRKMKYTETKLPVKVELDSGLYYAEVEAFNSKDIKIASSGEIKFTVSKQ